MSVITCEKCGKSFEFNNSDGHVICGAAYCDNCATDDKLLHSWLFMYDTLEKLAVMMPNGDMPLTLSDCYNDMHCIAREALKQIKESE